MIGPDERPPQTAPRFDHVLYGLPGEVPTVSSDEEPQWGSFELASARWLRASSPPSSSVVVQVGPYAMHERNLQAEAERSAQQRVEASSVDVAVAAEVDQARAALEERLDVAREVYAQSREILVTGDEAHVELRTAIADAEETLRADAPDVSELTEAAEELAGQVVQDFGKADAAVGADFLVGI